MEDLSSPIRATDSKLISFDEIFDSEDYVICDYSLSGPQEKSWFHDIMYSTHRFSQLDLAPMQKQIECSKIFLNTISHPKAITTKGISLESLATINLLTDKRKFLLKTERNKARRQDRRVNLEENGSVEKVVLDETYGLFRETYMQARRKIFCPNQKRLYDFLERMTRAVSDNTNAKIDYHLKYGDNKSNRFEDFHTDEQLVATGLYLSAFENKSGCILTRDTDIRRILVNTLAYLSCQKNPVFKEMFESVKKNRIRVYYMEDLAKATLKFDTSRFRIELKKEDIPERKLKEISSQIEPYNPFSN